MILREYLLSELKGKIKFLSIGDCLNRLIFLFR